MGAPAADRRVLWVSVSQDLRYDAVRDLRDVGADDVAVFPQVRGLVCTL